MSLHAKLAEIRSEFGPIRKDGTNKGVGDGYKFVQAGTVGARFVELASARGLTMLPVEGEVLDIRPSVSGKVIVYTLKNTWRITDAETGEFVDVVAFGQGADNADKALPKAQTNSMKYSIMMLLQSAGDDPEADGSTDQVEDRAAAARAATEARRAAQTGAPVARVESVQMASDGQKRKIRAEGREKGLEDEKLKAFTLAITGKESSKDWTAADADKIISFLDDVAQVQAALA